MPRQPRAIAPGFPHHVVQRGNNRQTIFFDREDRARYLCLLEMYSRKWQAPLLAYCLMNNHIHLLAKPEKEESLCQMMRVIGLSYTQYMNKKYGRTGTLWEGRYYSCIVGDESYLRAAARYIEQNPRRAGMVKRDEDYPYSSARAHIEEVEDTILREDLFEGWQRQDYVRLMSENVPVEAIKTIRRATKTGKLFASEEFRKKMERTLERKLILRHPGRQSKATKGVPISH